MRCFPFIGRNQLQQERGGLEGPGGSPSVRGRRTGGWLWGPAHPSAPPPPVRRYERLEEQLNDLTELHQNEMTNLKQELASMEEKVAYQSYERARDIQVDEREGSAPRCTLHPWGKGGTPGWEGGWARGIPSSGTLQMKSLLRCRHCKKWVTKPCPQNPCLCPSESPLC